MLVPQRNYSSPSYRYGFQGQEKDDEIKGNGNSLNYKFRMHDPRIGRFFAMDPLAKKYPWYTPYQFSGNKVIHMVELEGLEEATPEYVKETSMVLLDKANETATSRTNEENLALEESLQTWCQVQDWAGMLGKDISQYAAVSWAEGKGGYDIFDYKKAYNFLNFHSIDESIRSDFRSQLSELVDDVSSGEYSFTIQNTKRRSQTGDGTLINDFSTATSSFEIISSGDFCVTVGGNGGFSFTGQVYS